MIQSHIGRLRGPQTAIGKGNGMRIVALLLVIAVGVGTLLWQQFQTDPLIVSGTIEADEIRVGSRVGGRVSQVHVDEGDVAEPGKPLVELEPFDLREQLAQAKLQLAAQQATYEKLKAGYREEEIAQARANRDQAKAALDEAVAGPRKQEIQAARDSLAQAQAELQLAEKTFKRVEELYGRKAAPKEEYDQRLSELTVARAKVDVQSSQLALLEEGTRPEQIAQAQARLAQTQAQLDLLEHGYRPEEIEEAKARMQAAQAAVEIIEKQLAELTITAPTRSVVEAVDLREGDIIAANAPVISLLDLSRLWIRAYVPGRFLNYVQPGEELTIIVDGDPDRRLTGKVIFLAQEAEFTPSNVQTPEERGKRVFRIKVQLTGDTSMLHPGMNADVYLAANE